MTSFIRRELQEQITELFGGGHDAEINAEKMIDLIIQLGPQIDVENYQEPTLGSPITYNVRLIDRLIVLHNGDTAVYYNAEIKKWIKVGDKTSTSDVYYLRNLADDGAVVIMVPRH